jgi:hypothetical protein
MPWTRVIQNQVRRIKCLGIGDRKDGNYIVLCPYTECLSERNAKITYDKNKIRPRPRCILCDFLNVKTTRSTFSTKLKARQVDGKCIAAIQCDREVEEGHTKCFAHEQYHREQENYWDYNPVSYTMGRRDIALTLPSDEVIKLLKGAVLPGDWKPVKDALKIGKVLLWDCEFAHSLLVSVAVLAQPAMYFFTT